MTIRETLSKENFIIHTIKGISMLPLLVQDEDLVLVERVKDNLRDLDMVLFTRGDNTYVLHRIMDIKNSYYLICGDNQNTLEKVKKDQIIGKVTTYYKKGRKVSIKDKEYIDYLRNLECNLNNRIHLNLIGKDIKDFISLVSSSIQDKPIKQEGFDYKAIYKIGEKQSLNAFIYKSIDKSLCPTGIYAKFRDKYNNTLKRNILFDNERKIVFNKLNENKIDHLELKGSTISKLYKDPNTRFSTDIDILVRKFDGIKEIMLSQGYDLKTENDHLLAFSKKPCFNFEFHTKASEQESDYFDILFDLAILKSKYEYELSNEDLLAFFICHMHKHDISGAGLRFYIDLYYINKKLSFDEEKLKKILTDNNLYDYYLKVLEIADKILINKEYPIVPLNLIFKGNTFGYEETRVKQKVKQKGKVKYILSRLFPKPSYIYQIYPIVRKYNVLLPFGYLYRILHINKHKNHSKEINILFKK